MKKRLRKKLRRGEFAEYGFSLLVEFSADAKYDQMDRFLETVESLNLGFGGSVDSNIFNGFVTRPGRGVTSNAVDFRGLVTRRRGCTEEHRTALVSALQILPEVISVEAGPLEDAWR